MAPLPTQQVFFTCFDYGNPYDAEDGKAVELPQTAMVLTGIAKPQPLYAYLEAHGVEIRPLAFSDHHNFTPSDVERINATFEALPEGSKVITTEKDAVRLQPIEVKFLFGKSEDFNSYIYNYVDAN